MSNRSALVAQTAVTTHLTLAGMKLVSATTESTDGTQKQRHTKGRTKILHLQDGQNPAARDE